MRLYIGLSSVIAVCVVFLFLSSTVRASHPVGESINLYLAGASTVETYDADRAPRAGWGQSLHEFLTDHIVVKNYARSGRSTKSFINEGRLDAILSELRPGDYLMIHFAHNDQKIDDPDRYTEPYGEYQSNLKLFIEKTRDQGAHPILVTPVNRRTFDARGRLKSTLQPYADAMKQVGLDMGVPIIDLHERSRAFYEVLGERGTKPLFLWLEPGEHPNYPEGEQDNTHFSELGAMHIAKLVMEGLVDLDHPLAKYITHENYPDFPAYIVEIPSMTARTRISGALPVDMKSLHLDMELGLQKVIVDIDGSVIYSGSSLPPKGHVVIDTFTLRDGHHTLNVRTVHEQTGEHDQTWYFEVRNYWVLHQNMMPPVVSGGWFGDVDYLQTLERSDGWGYDTENKDLFFGDPHRLKRMTDGEEFLIWETPRFKSLEMTLYTDSDIPVQNGLTVSVSSTGSDWITLPYKVEAQGKERVDGWSKVTIVAVAEKDLIPQYVRITLQRSLEKDSIQIGDIVLTGYRD